MASKRKQRGWLNFLAPIAGAVVGGMMSKSGQDDTNEANQGMNLENRMWNAEQAQINREFQTVQRQTQYQTAVGDLKAAGLNPMLAYGNGGAGMANGAVAANSAPIPMQNSNQAMMNGAAAAAAVQNTQAQTKLLEAQKEKTEAEIPLTVGNTGKVVQETENLKEGLNQITSQIKNINMDTLNKEEQVTLTRAQQQLVNVQKELARGQITYVQAQERTERAIGSLRGLEIHGAKNTADFEKAMGEKVGTGAGSIRGVLEILKGWKR